MWNQHFQLEFKNKIYIILYNIRFNGYYCYYCSQLYIDIHITIYILVFSIMIFLEDYSLYGSEFYRPLLYSKLKYKKYKYYYNYSLVGDLQNRHYNHKH